MGSDTPAGIGQRHRHLDEFPGRGLIVDKHPFDMRYLAADHPLDLLADLVRFQKIICPEPDLGLQEPVPAGVSSDKRANVDHRRPAFNERFDFVDGVAIDGCIEQHPHPIGKQLPTGTGHEHEHERRCNLIHGDTPQIETRCKVFDQG